MHRPSALLPLFGGLLLALFAAPRGTFAADPVVPGQNVPRFAVKDVALTAAGLPEGWKVAPTDVPLAEEKALLDGITAAATEAKEPDVVPLTLAFLTPEGKTVVVALAESLRDPTAFATSAQAAAAKNGWSYRDLGTPARVVLVSGPQAAREQALAAQVATAVRFLAKRAAEILDTWRAGQGSPIPAYVFSQGVLNIDPKHAPSHLIKGDMILRMEANGRAGALVEDAVVHFRAALDKQATSPLSGDPLVEAHGLLGESLLRLKPPQDAQGRDALKEAVKRLPGSKVRREIGLRFLYNLACAHGRLKETDEAFARLTTFLEDMAKATDAKPDQGWRTDPDFASLRDDPRWAELVKKYPEKAPEVVK